MEPKDWIIEKDRIAEEHMSAYQAILEDQQAMLFSQLGSIDKKGVKGILSFFDGDLEEAILDTYLEAGLVFGDDLVFEERADDYDEALSEAIQEETNILKEKTDIQDSTADQIGKQMEHGAREGWTTAQLQQAIMDVSVFKASRALRIARTVTGAGASQGQFLSGKMVGASHKIWSTAGDTHVRDAHQKLNNKKIGIDETFSNGGRYPLDPRLSAAERINCRCGLLFVRGEAPPLTDADFGATEPPEDPMMKAQSLISCTNKPFKKDWDERSFSEWMEYRAKELRRDACKGYRRTTGGRWVDADGKNVSDDISRQLNELKTPPGWVNVTASSDPAADLLLVGQDSKGRWKYVYSDEHYEAADIDKFNRVKLFSKDMDSVRDNVEAGIVKGDTQAYLLRLEDETGIRIGSTADTGADVQAYGLTTLEGRHVKIDGDIIKLDFIAKEGIPASYEVSDQVVADFLKDRLDVTDAAEQMFPDVDNTKLNKYLKKMSGGKKYTVKDYRTYNGTRIAYEELQKYSGKVYTVKEKEKIIKEVSTAASEFLMNTPAMAKKSYIDPMVWDIIGGLP